MSIDCSGMEMESYRGNPGFRIEDRAEKIHFAANPSGMLG